ncbi:hypothetical protein CHH72_11515 [Shouchella clausii]|uniref:Uncharacterized protein n=1 Tax=Shouchella clausii TaxID=79880 RepID=A0A268NZS0_SHOCL|nr:hypothetical protein CHH72_11515 [Shouchella clausii]
MKLGITTLYIQRRELRFRYLPMSKQDVLPRLRHDPLLSNQTMQPVRYVVHGPISFVQLNA